MKLLAAFLCSVILAAAVSAQDAPAAPVAQDWVTQSLTRHAWELGLLGGGGLGFGKSDNTQFAYAGGRVGWILTGNHLRGMLHGNFEWAVDILPLYAVLPPSGGVYGGSFKPVIWQWNFTSWQKMAPYMAIAGGIVFTKSNIPPGDTSQVNFTPQFVVGTHLFVKPRRALFLEGSFGHLSSASLGDHNPGYNGTFLFTVGYSWLKGGRE
jgi:lipid A 3-O-deacylase